MVWFGIVKAKFLFLFGDYAGDPDVKNTLNILFVNNSFMSLRC